LIIIVIIIFGNIILLYLVYLVNIAPVR